MIDLLYTKYLKATISYEHDVRIETYPFLREAVREVIYNALGHNNYAASIPIQIRVEDEALYISNSCILPRGWTVQTLLEKHKSIPFNPSIANVFYRAGYIEAWGRGIQKVMTSCAQKGFPPPEYSIIGDSLTVKFDAYKFGEHPSEVGGKVNGEHHGEFGGKSGGRVSGSGADGGDADGAGEVGGRFNGEHHGEIGGKNRAVTSGKADAEHDGGKVDAECADEFGGKVSAGRDGEFVGKSGGIIGGKISPKITKETPSKSMYGEKLPFESGGKVGGKSGGKVDAGCDGEISRKDRSVAGGKVNGERSSSIDGKDSTTTSSKVNVESGAKTANGVNSTTVAKGKENFMANLSANEQLVALQIEQNPKVTTAHISKACSLPRRTVERILKSLKDKQFITRNGSSRNGSWEIII